jgi:hypothetical protein
MTVILRPEAAGLIAHLSTREDGSPVVEIGKPGSFPPDAEGTTGTESRLDVMGVYAGRLITFPKSG